MELEKVINERYSVRKFSEQEILQSDLNKILEAGRIAPTACNFQPQRIFVIKSKEAKEKLKSICRMTFDAPVILLSCADMTKSWKNKREEGYDSAEMDVSIVGTQMMLEAWNLGIGSCWVRAFNSNDVKEVLELPENIKPIFLMPIGYMTDESIPNKELHYTRNKMEDMVKYI